jgi:hypothetical protein
VYSIKVDVLIVGKPNLIKFLAKLRQLLYFHGLWCIIWCVLFNRFLRHTLHISRQHEIVTIRGIAILFFELLNLLDESSGFIDTANAKLLVDGKAIEEFELLALYWTEISVGVL